MLYFERDNLIIKLSFEFALEVVAYCEKEQISGKPKILKANLALFTNSRSQQKRQKKPNIGY
jgi:hypothetical protein